MLLEIRIQPSMKQSDEHKIRAKKWNTEQVMTIMKKLKSQVWDQEPFPP
jgi:hypothetical protein